MTTGYVIVAGVGLKDAKYTILKDPDAVLDYPFNYTDWLEEIADTIQTASASVTGSIEVASPDDLPVDDDGKIVTPMVSGGLNGETCSLTVHIETVGGRQDARTIYLKIKER